MSRDSVKAIVSYLEELLTNIVMKLPTKVTTLIRNDYRPKLDETDEVENSELAMYQELIGELILGGPAQD